MIHSFSGEQHITQCVLIQACVLHGYRPLNMRLRHGTLTPNQTSNSWKPSKGVTRDYRTTSSPSQMIVVLGWEPLYQRRANFKLVMVYISHMDSSTFQRHCSCIHQHWALKATLRYMIPYFRTDVYPDSFIPSAIRLWNQLPENIEAAPTLDDIRMGLASQV